VLPERVEQRDLRTPEPEKFARLRGATISSSCGLRGAISAKPTRTDRAGPERRAKAEAGPVGQSPDQAGSAGPGSWTNSRSLPIGQLILGDRAWVAREGRSGEAVAWYGAAAGWDRARGTCREASRRPGGVGRPARPAPRRNPPAFTAPGPAGAFAKSTV